MKKVFMTLVAAATLMFAACGGSTTNNAGSDAKAGESTGKAAADEAVWPVDASVKLDQTFDDAKFSVQFPAEFAPKTVSGSDFYVCTESGDAYFQGTYNTEGVDISELASLADNYAFMLKNDNTVEDPIVKGNRYVIKATNDATVIYSYGVMKEDKVGIMGEFKFPKADAAKYDKYVGAAINSIKFK